MNLVNSPEDASPEVTPLAVIDRVERLYHVGHLFLTLDAKFDRAAMIREIDQTRDRKFSFGRTPSGDALWRKYSAVYYPEGREERSQSVNVAHREDLKRNVGSGRKQRESQTDTFQRSLITLGSTETWPLLP